MSTQPTRKLLGNGPNQNPGPRVGNTPEAEAKRQAHLFKPGNPGRPKGTRHQLTTKFLRALYADFDTHGEEVLERVRAEDPSTYLRVVASLVPKELEIKRPLEELNDDELDAAIDYIRSALGERAEGVSAGEANQAAGKPH